MVGVVMTEEGREDGDSATESAEVMTVDAQHEEVEYMQAVAEEEDSDDDDDDDNDDDDDDDDDDKATELNRSTMEAVSDHHHQQQQQQQKKKNEERAGRTATKPVPLIEIERTMSSTEPSSPQSIESPRPRAATASPLSPARPARAPFLVLTSPRISSALASRLALFESVEERSTSTSTAAQCWQRRVQQPAPCTALVVGKQQSHARSERRTRTGVSSAVRLLSRRRKRGRGRGHLRRCHRRHRLRRRFR
jgi:hypothetical protein